MPQEEHQNPHCLILNKTLRIWLSQTSLLASPRHPLVSCSPVLGSQAHTTVLDFLCVCWWENVSPHAYMKNIWLNEASTELQISFLFGDKNPLYSKGWTGTSKWFCCLSLWKLGAHHPTQLRFISFFGGAICILPKWQSPIRTYWNNHAWINSTEREDWHQLASAIL